jgi:hypothetical protein
MIDTSHLMQKLYNLNYDENDRMGAVYMMMMEMKYLRNN